MNVFKKMQKCQKAKWRGKNLQQKKPNVNTKVSRGVGVGGGAPGRAAVFLQPVEGSTEEMAYPCRSQMRDT